jgi:hypothetical protein
VTAAVIALSLLGLGNLLLTAGIVRRLKEHTTLLDRLAGPPPELMRPAGSAIGDFAVTAVDGTPVAADLLVPPTIVGFFSPGCGPCHERLPEFAGRVRRAPVGRALAVVVGEAADSAEMVATLGEVALVVNEPVGGPVAKAFGVRGFPAFGLVGEDGRIEASGNDLGSIPMLVAA